MLSSKQKEDAEENVKKTKGVSTNYSDHPIKNAIAIIAEKRHLKGGDKAAINYLNGRKSREIEKMQLREGERNCITHWCDHLIAGYEISLSL